MKQQREILGIFAAVMLACGCQASDHVSPGSAHQGLTLLNSSRADGLVGMYVEGENVVFFETLTDQPGDTEDHRLDHGDSIDRPLFSARWSDAEGRGIYIHQSGSRLAFSQWQEPENSFMEPARWDALLDLTAKAARALSLLDVPAEVREEQVQLVQMASEIPAANQRALPVTPEQLAQINTRERPYGYLGYSWFQSFSVREHFAHQCTQYDNYRYYSGGWHYYNTILNGNGDTCDVTKCTASTYVQDYKGASVQCTNGYQFCMNGSNLHNCRSSALRQQNYVMGNVYCSTTGGMCYHPEAAVFGTGGADCEFRSNCATRDICFCCGT
jgi:hypothetical protein